MSATQSNKRNYIKLHFQFLVYTANTTFNKHPVKKLWKWNV